MATKNVKYPGKLGIPISYREIEAVVREASEANGDIAEVRTAVHDWIARREVELLFDLLDHYKIGQDNKIRWYLLAHKLASMHVPAFRNSSKVGRPPRSKTTGQTLADLLMEGSKRKPGRKLEFTDAVCKGLLHEVRQICVRNGLKGRGAVRNALKEMLKIEAQKQGKSVSAFTLKKLDFFQKRHSDAKKRFPELA